MPEEVYFQKHTFLFLAMKSSTLFTSRNHHSQLFHQVEPSKSIARIVIYNATHWKERIYTIYHSTAAELYIYIAFRQIPHQSKICTRTIICHTKE